MRFFQHVRLAGLLLLGILAVTIASGPSKAMSQQRARPVVTLHCAVTAPQVESLCQALVQRLAAEVPGAVIRRVATPVDDTPMLVALDAAVVSARQMSGRLSWKRGTTARQQGPEVRFDVMDATLSATVYDGFAQGLIRASPDFRLALQTFRDASGTF